MDVKATFLNGNLENEIFIKISPRVKSEEEQV